MGVFEAVQKVFQKVQMATNFAELVDKSETQENIEIDTENENLLVKSTKQEQKRGKKASSSKKIGF